MPFIEVSTPDSARTDSGPLVDIVAVHGLYESSLQTWTDPQTNVLWLRDLLPPRLCRARVLLYEYNSSPLVSLAEGDVNMLLPYATTLIAELCALRSDSSTHRRPIIFVCHGIGGLLVKRALAFSHRRQTRQVAHQQSICLSTCAILFMGTPHNGVKKESMLLPGRSNLSLFVIGLLEGSAMIVETRDLFAPLLQTFRIFNFWEESRTSIGEVKTYIVDKESAAPNWVDVEQCGLQGTHSSMVKFGSADSLGFDIIQEAFQRYTDTATEIIESRWHEYDIHNEPQDSTRLGGRHQAPLSDVPTNDSFTTNTNTWFLVERKPTPYFTGREANARNIRNKFSEAQRQLNRRDHAIFVVYGLGGSGKTQFSLKYVHDNRSRYWGVFWIDASTADNAESDFAKIDQSVRGGANYARSSSCSAAMHWLVQCRQPWLLVLDNADDPDMDVSRYIPAGSNGHILITTRNPNVTEYATIGHIRFRGMDPEEAISLLLRSASSSDHIESPNPRSRSLAKGIAFELGYLALPLAQAGAAIRRKIFTLDRYLHHYLGHRKLMMSYSRVRDIDDANVITTWEIPFQRIVQRPTVHYKDAVDLLHIFAFLHYESIPEEIFERAWRQIEESQENACSYPNFLQLNHNEDFQARLRSAIRVLAEYSIVDHELSTRACALHPIIHAWSRERLDSVEQKKWLSYTASILALSISPRLEASGRSFRQLLLPHINFCLQALKQHYPSFPSSAAHAIELEKFAWLYAENGIWETARDLQIKVIEYRKRHFGRWHQSTLRAKQQLGFTYWNLFAMRPLVSLQLWMLLALWFSRPSLKYWLCWAPWLPTHIQYCIALDELGKSLWLIGKRERAKQVGQRAVNGLTKHLGPEDPQTLNAMFNLARTYLHLDRHEKSKEMLVYVLRTRKRYFGMDHLDTLMTRNELGILLCAQRKHLHLAEILVANVLESRRKILGEEHAYTLWSVNDLSKVICERGRPLEAVKMLQNIIPIVERTLGDDHVGMSMTKSNLARALALCEDWASAERLLSSTLKTIPKDHPDWIHTNYGYIRIQFRLQNLEVVEKGCVEMLDHIAKTRSLAMDNIRTIAIAEELLKVYKAQNRLLDIAELKTRVPFLDEDNLVEDTFDVNGIRRSSQMSKPSRNAQLLASEDVTGSSQVTNDARSDAGKVSRPIYRYSPLVSNTSFRILELLPAKRGAVLTYHLHSEDWTSKPAYEALSYAWGNPKIKIPTICDGRVLEITQNLHTGLSQLRYTDRSRFLWADAICIDQKNIQERGQQVSVMRQIYKSARNVVVWLGEDEDGQAHKAAQFIRAVTNTLCDEIPGGIHSIGTMDDLYGLTNNPDPTQDAIAWLPVSWYFSRPWFQRLWVFQEVNSGTDVDFICGDTHLSWDAVGLAATYIKRWPTLRESVLQGDDCFWYNAYIMRSRHHQATMSAASMLSQGQNFITTDPLDRIFALLGTLPLRAWETRLRPDYKRTRQNLYLDVARRCLLDDKDPFFLSYVQHNHGVSFEDFPSWIPQWDQDRVRVPIAIAKANWAACGHSSISARTVGASSVLKMQGVVIDRVTSKHDVDPDKMFGSQGDQDGASVHPLLRLWRQERDCLSSFHLSPEKILAGFAATFVLEYRLTYKADYQHRCVQDFIAYVAHLSKVLGLRPDDYPELSRQHLDGEWRNYVHAAHSTSKRRSFFKSFKGYMGLGPNAMQCGDLICILLGCKVPYVLRQVEGHFLLVGDAYINGIMNGEVMDQITSGELKEIILTIH